MLRLESGRAAYGRVEAPNCLDVVIQDVRLGVDDSL